jgi:hypothetical protein
VLIAILLFIRSRQRLKKLKTIFVLEVVLLLTITRENVDIHQELVRDAI